MNLRVIRDSGHNDRRLRQIEEHLRQTALGLPRSRQTSPAHLKGEGLALATMGKFVEMHHLLNALWRLNRTQTPPVSGKKDARPKVAPSWYWGLSAFMLAQPAFAPWAVAQSSPSSASTTLGPVVVTATATEHSSLESPSFTTVITAEDIEKAAPANGIPDLLRDFVGVNNSSDNMGRDEVVVRGLGADYTLILVNGRRISSSSALWRGGDFDYNSIPLASIERIEVARGPMAALYGSDAIGGVVNIITKKPTKEWSGQVSADYRFVESGSGGDQYRVNGYASGAITDTVSANISAEYYQRDPWFTQTKDNGTVPALEEKALQNLRGGVTWNLTPEQTLAVDYAYNHDERPFNIYDDRPSYREQEISRHTVGLSHSGAWSWGSTLVEGSYERGAIDDYNTTYNAPKQRSLVEQNSYLHAKGTVPWGRHVFTGGLEYRSQLIEDAATYLDTGKFGLDQTAGYLQDEVMLLDDLTLTVGGRLDHHEMFGNNVTGRANLVYQLIPGVALKGGISQGFKAPDAYQLSPEYSVISCGGGCYLSGNKDLSPEKSLNTELGVEVQQGTWNLSVVGFRNQVEDMIIAVYDAGPPASREWQNKSSVRLKGVEVSGGVDLLPTLSLNGNYTYLYTRDDNGAELDNRPRHQATTSLAWQATEMLSATASANYTGSQWEGNTKLPSYRTFDLGANASLTDTLKIKAGVQNVTDVVLSEKSSAFLQHELGRNYYLGATYTF